MSIDTKQCPMEKGRVYTCPLFRYWCLLTVSYGQGRVYTCPLFRYWCLWTVSYGQDKVCCLWLCLRWTASIFSCRSTHLAGEDFINIYVLSYIFSSCNVVFQCINRLFDAAHFSYHTLYKNCFQYLIRNM